MDYIEKIHILEKKIKQLEEENERLKQASKDSLFLQQLLSLIPEHIYWKDLGSTYLGCNDQFAKMFGFSSRIDVIGNNEYTLNQGVNAEKVIKQDQEVVEKNKALSMEEEAYDHLGKKRIFLSRKAPVLDQIGKPIGIVGVSFDITDRKRMEEDLIKAKEAAEVANELKDEFIMNMTHDFNTPLIGLNYPSEVLYKALDKFDPDLQEMIEIIYTSTQRMNDLVKQILDFGRINSGRLEVKSEKVNLGELIRLTVDNTAARCHEKGLELVIHYPLAVPRHIISDSMYITRILLNLVSNAIRYTPTGTITITVDEAPTDEDGKIGLTISVSDTGIGIPENKLKTIFEKFTRIEPSSKADDYTAGVGLGLSIVQQFVNTLNGTISVKSKEGEGSTFTVALPVIMDEASPALNSFARTHPDLGVLLISGNTAMAESMAYQLITPGFELYHINQVELELQKAKEKGQTFAIILLDTSPGLDPIAFKSQLKHAPQDALWVLLTKPLTQVEKEAILKAGFVGIIQKPILPEELHPALQSIYEHQHRPNKPNQT